MFDSVSELVGLKNEKFNSDSLIFDSIQIWKFEIFNSYLGS